MVGGMEGGRKGGREGRREGGRVGGWEGERGGREIGREGGREGEGGKLVKEELGRGGEGGEGGGWGGREGGREGVTCISSTSRYLVGLFILFCLRFIDHQIAFCESLWCCLFDILCLAVVAQLI